MKNSFTLVMSANQRTQTHSMQFGPRQYEVSWLSAKTITLVGSIPALMEFTFRCRELEALATCCNMFYCFCS